MFRILSIKNEVFIKCLILYKQYLEKVSQKSFSNYSIKSLLTPEYRCCFYTVGYIDTG